MNTPTLNHIKLLILAFILSVGISTLSAWTNPPGAPTTCPTGTPGCDAPVHIGPAGQIKTGGLSLGSGLDDTGVGLAVLGGKVGVGVEDPTEKVDVVGRVKTSAGYCIGASCIDAWPTGGGPGGTGNVPSGAVIAFNLSSCPAGWSAFASAAGRNIVGVTGGYALGSTGGASTHTLSVAQMPSHNHPNSLSTGSYLYQGGWGSTQAGNGGSSANNNFQTNQVSISVGSQGGGQAFNIMDPYVALLYCVKD